MRTFNCRKRSKHFEFFQGSQDAQTRAAWSNRHANSEKKQPTNLLMRRHPISRTLAGVMLRRMGMGGRGVDHGRWCGAAGAVPRLGADTIRVITPTPRVLLMLISISISMALMMKILMASTLDAGQTVSVLHLLAGHYSLFRLLNASWFLFTSGESYDDGISLIIIQAVSFIVHLLIVQGIWVRVLLKKLKNVRYKIENPGWKKC